MRVCVITSPFCALPPDAIGAIERRWFNTVSCFAEKGHVVQLIGKRDKTVLPSEPAVRRDYVPGFNRTGSVYGDIVLDFFYSLQALWRMKTCDILVSNTFWGPILAPLLFRRKYGKLVYNVARFPKGHLKLYKGVDLFACTSKAVASALKKIVPMFSQRICVVSNPVEIAPVEGVARQEFLIGYHGRVHGEKGLDILAGAIALLAKEYPAVRMKVIGPWEVGKGGSGEVYKTKIDELSGGRCDWMGSISDRGKLAAELQTCSAYCYPSVAEKGETFGVSPLEAMALGLPTVVSGLECFEDFVRDGENGLVFDHRAPDPVGALVVQLRRLLKDSTFAAQLGTAAAKTAKDFSTEIIAERWLEKFNKVLKGEWR